jgi:hypothetical protein
MPKTARLRQTRLPRGIIVRSYSMRNMRQDFLDRIRITMAQHKVATLEQEVLNVIERGLRVREKEPMPPPGVEFQDLRGGIRRGA